MRRRRWLVCATGVILVAAAGVLHTAQPRTSRASGTGWHVAAGSSGDGSQQRPFGRVTDALARAGPGDEVILAPGVYHEPLVTVRGGQPGAPLVIRALRPESRPTLMADGRVATIGHPHVVLDGVILDGAYGSDDAMRVGAEASHLVLRNLEVRRSGRDCIDMGGPSDVLVERVLIHHCLDSRANRTDAHGLVATNVERLTLRDAEIHTFSGDGVQLDPSRSSPGWTDVRLERVKLWLAPLPTAANGFAAGTVPGENGIDTKTPRDGRRSRLDVSDVQAWGFRNGLIKNMAAFNIKERVDATFDRVTVHDSEIAFRLRGPGDRGATTVIRDAVVHHVGTAVRYEDDLASMRLERMTVGLEVPKPFRAVNADSTQSEVRDLFVLGGTLPAEARGHGRVVGREAFVDVTKHDYRRRK